MIVENANIKENVGKEMFVFTINPQKLIMRLSNLGEKMNSLNAPPITADWVSQIDSSNSRMSSGLTERASATS